MSSHISHENLLSSRGIERSDPILENHPALCRKKSNCDGIGNPGCIYGSDDQTAVEGDATCLQIEKRLFRNILVLGIGLSFVVGTFNALQYLQSSLFLMSAVGVKSLCIVYACAVISGFYGPLFVEWFTPNWTTILATVVVALFTSSFFYPQLYTLTPTGVLLGLVFGPFFSSQTTFMMQLVTGMTYLTPDMRKKAQKRYIRLCLFFSNSYRIWGNIVAALLIHYGGDIMVYLIGPEDPAMFRMKEYNEDDNSIGYYSFPYSTVAKPSLCALDKATDDNLVRKPTAYILVLPINLDLMLISVFLGLTFVGVAIVTTLLDKCELYVSRTSPEQTIKHHFSKVLKAFVDPQFKFLLPMMLFMGLEQGFIYTDFTRSYVCCALDLEAVPLTMMAMAIMNTATALAIHWFSKHFRSWNLIAVGFICQAGLLMVLKHWTPVKDDVAVFYIIATGWGFCHAIWETLISTHIAMTYADNWGPQFIAYFMTQWLGLSIAFGWSWILVTSIKIYVLAATLIFATSLYLFFEFRTSARQKEQDRITEI